MVTPIVTVGADVVSLLWQIDTSHVIWGAAIYLAGVLHPVTVNKDHQK